MSFYSDQPEWLKTGTKWRSGPLVFPYSFNFTNTHKFFHSRSFTNKPDRYRSDSSNRDLSKRHRRTRWMDDICEGLTHYRLSYERFIRVLANECNRLSAKFESHFASGYTHRQIRETGWRSSCWTSSKSSIMTASPGIILTALSRASYSRKLSDERLPCLIGFLYIILKICSFWYLHCI